MFSYLQLWEVEEGLEVRDIVEAEIVVGDDDWLVVGDLLAGVSHQNPPSTCLYVSLRVVVTLTQCPLSGFLHGQGPEFTVVLDQPLGHLVVLVL